MWAHYADIGFFLFKTVMMPYSKEFVQYLQVKPQLQQKVIAL